MAAGTGECVCLPAERFAAVDMLGLPRRLFTSDPCAARIHAFPRHQACVPAHARSLLHIARQHALLCHWACAMVQSRTCPAIAPPAFHMTSAPKGVTWMGRC